MSADAQEIDDSLYSRQRYVLGDGAMKKLAKANLLIIGLGGVGVEIAKNVVLAGVKSVVLHDPKLVSEEDLGAQFFLQSDDIESKLTRGTACCKRLSELNPHVTISVLEELPFDDFKYLENFQCVIATEMLFSKQIQIDEFCRQQNPAIPFISSDVHGVFSYLFCDFGKEFSVFDSDGEESKDIMIQSITKGNPALITTLEYKRHGLETGDQVMLKEVKGMEELNGKCFQITYVDPYSFTIDCDTSTTSYTEYQHSGVFSKQKLPTTVNHTSIERQLSSPDVLLNDLSKLDAPLHSLTYIQALHRYLDGNKIENIVNDMDRLKKITVSIRSEMTCKSDKINEEMFKCLVRTCRGKLAPLCAAIGGIAAQEVLKAVSGKFTPLKQWLLLDAMEVAPDSDVLISQTGRYFYLHNCVTTAHVEKLRNLKLFLVGCGAIGCEMLKNFALLGIGAGEDGLITITDNDLIEKSNLNRQFLFRPWHLQKPKSVTAAKESLVINPDLHIVAHQNKVSVETQEKIYNDEFFGTQDVIVNALDNVEARKYVDSRCVSNKRALIETGTMGPKGHVQVIVPFLTESYSNQRDPADEDVPYCTLKSFPQVIEHTIQWARDKFENLFNLKPNNFNKFWSTNKSIEDVANIVSINSVVPDGFVDAVRLLQRKPKHWTDCVKLARIKFEQYFNHKAKQLLHVFPLDTKLSDGSWFWQSPKRPPTPIDFSIQNSTHILFVQSCARLLANVNGISINEEDAKEQNIVFILDNISVPEFNPTNKKIETDADAKMSVNDVGEDKIEQLIAFLEENKNKSIKVHQLSAEHFEKDDDSNGHIDFITSASNLRAIMYNIKPVDRFQTKRIAGKIIPAIATTTAAIAGLATLELLKVIAQHPIESLKNTFLNLALPMMVLSEPGAAPKTKIIEGLEFSSWDHWEVQGNTEFTLTNFIQHFKSKYNLKISMVCQGVKMIYVPFMPGHSKRLNQTMLKLLKPNSNDKYVDLIISFEAVDTNPNDEADDLPAPPVRYFYHSEN